MSTPEDQPQTTSEAMEEFRAAVAAVIVAFREDHVLLAFLFGVWVGFLILGLASLVGIR